MELLGVILGSLALIVAVTGFPMLYELFKDWAALSLLKDIKVKPLAEIKSDGEKTYWLIQLKAGKGNWACRLLKQRAKIVLAVATCFQPLTEESGIFHSYAYEFDLDIRDRHLKFSIAPNARRTLVVAQRVRGNVLQTMGDSFGFSYLEGSYNLVLSLKHNGNDTGITKNISHYIEHGNPNIRSENINEV